MKNSLKARKELKKRIYDGERITNQDAGELFEWDLLELGMAGNIRRQAVFPDEGVGFIIDRIINFTNICAAACNFCAYHARAGVVEPYELSLDSICCKVQELTDAGGTQVMLQGGLHPDYTIENYIRMVNVIKERFPHIYLHSFSPSELFHIAHKSKLSLDDVVCALKRAGLDSVPGASDLLVDRIRKKVCPNKLTRQQWCEVMTTLHRHGMKSSATMTYGMGETIEEKVGHLAQIRSLQDQTGILRAFIPWSFSPLKTGMEEIIPATGIEYLKTVAVSRIFLDNIVYIQAGWLTEGLKLAQIALTMGANDMGGVLTEEVVVKATGIDIHTDVDDLVDIIKNAGKSPFQRDSEYNIIKWFK